MIREGRVRVGDGHRRYLEAGAGWPVLFLHAFPLNADMWRPQLDRVPAGWRFIAPDLRGFGPGAAEVSLAAIDDLATDVGSVLDALELERVVVCGLSLGGYVAFAAWRAIPERISALVLADTRPHADSPEGRDGRRAMMALVDEKGVGAVTDEMLPKLLGETTRRERPNVVQRVRDIAAANTASAVKSALNAMMDRPDSSPALATLGRPVLVLVGEEDTITPPAVAEEMHRAVNRSQFVVIPAAGHLSNLEAPEAFSLALANFLSSAL